ncbi:hypothetical protein EMPS_09106 [Entomortierella parvispora]|uniref:F-box domain-containing protein n=1 Tax=Entomortierella parvispora TaxID=205924 RepID=A0A9P3M029_9FUNG|nr:hypothetical protein EMPS_09106 [Entomortierella parvispora]
MTSHSGQGIDQRLPAEVWREICSYLYLSQLCRLSMVNHTLDAIVGQLPIWRYLYNSFSPNKRLRLLFNKPALKSYMLYVCANSLHICEECYWYARAATLVYFPLPVLVPLPKFCPSNEEDYVDDLKVAANTSALGTGELQDHRPELMYRIPSIHGDGPIEYMNDDGNEFLTTEGIQDVGTPLNTTWTVRKCLDCRKKQREKGGPREIIGIPIPKIVNSYDRMTVSEWRHLYPGYGLDARGRATSSIHFSFPVHEDTVIHDLKQKYGGAEDVQASKMSSKESYAKTKARILWYRQQD